MSEVVRSAIGRRTIEWVTPKLRVVLSYGHDRPVGVHSIGEHSVSGGGATLTSRSDAPAVEVLTAAEGRARSTSRLTETLVGSRLRYISHERRDEGTTSTLTVRQADAASGLEVDLELRADATAAAMTSRVTVRNRGTSPALLLATPALALELHFGLADESFAADTTLFRASSDWLAESRWTSAPLRESLVDWSRGAHGSDGRGQVSAISTGSWSTGRQLPVGAIEAAQVGSAQVGSAQCESAQSESVQVESAQVESAQSESAQSESVQVESAQVGSAHAGAALVWQVDHSGPWRWELAENQTGIAIALSGPTDLDHSFSRRLDPGEEHSSPRATVAIGVSFELAVAELTAARRARRHTHPDDDRPAVVYNDFMNTLMGDPTTEAVLPLVAAAAAVGAEVYCIDAGWYDDGDDWWDKVGQWRPSMRRFPGGLDEVTDAIAAAGMRSGLWFEPEVVGVNSPVAAALPDDAFLSRSGIRIREHDRFHLDFNTRSAVEHVSGAVEGLVDSLGLSYLKLDYNIDPGAGSDRAAASPGEGLSAHSAGYLGWIDGLRMRHPSLILENCASGAMRADSPLLDRMQAQSTSDQQDWRRYPPIAASAALSMLPEQAASWAYPQPEMSDEEIAFTCSTSMLGRMYLSGRLDRMTDRQREIVGAAVAAHKSLRSRIGRSTPFWPTGLPGWDDPWLTYGLVERDAHAALLTIWKRMPPESTLTVPLTRFRGLPLEVTAVFPELGDWRVDWDPDAGVLEIATGDEPYAARTIAVQSRPAALSAGSANGTDREEAEPAGKGEQ